MSLPSTTYFHELHAKLTQLQSAPVPDLVAIDAVIDELAKEQLRLKAADGQAGNNPIEPRHRPDAA